MTTPPGTLYIISAPSGGGKTSLVRALLGIGMGLSLSVSYTSRPARAGEIDGHDYHFVTREVFEQKLKHGEFLESAEVYGNYYGTSKKWIDENVAVGHDVLLEIDSQGAQQVRRVFPAAVTGSAGNAFAAASQGQPRSDQPAPGRSPGRDRARA